ncbi:MAG: SoxR reducing system RseC family protein [Prolixibacteraceae bacterium]|nr:SoxR reducing system RseC family protein [Prolixibacteraceae bacterium]
MDSSNKVIHNGFVKEINPGKIKVGMTVLSGCASCNIKGACSMAEKTDKDIEIECNSNDYKIGQEVMVELETSLGLKAILFSYVLPLVIIITTLIIASSFLQNELLVALLALTSVIPYYLILYLFRRNISKKFTYNVSHIN